jgi:hypothetical protein
MKLKISMLQYKNNTDLGSRYVDEYMNDETCWFLLKKKLSLYLLAGVVLCTRKSYNRFFSFMFIFSLF